MNVLRRNRRCHEMQKAGIKAILIALVYIIIKLIDVIYDWAVIDLLHC